MKIYNEIVFDIDGNVIYEDSYEYSGDVMLLQETDIEKHNRLSRLITKAMDAGAEDNYYSSSETAKIKALVDQLPYGSGFDSTFGAKIALINAAYEGSDETKATIEGREKAIEATDIQLNALPSVPSVSGAGAVSPTGVVNWNAIPGGFQPLPQTAGTRKKLYQLSQFHGGINQKSSPRDIADIECQEATNVTVSSVGRIKLLGDCGNTNVIGGADVAGTVTENVPGFGLFQFSAPADQGGGEGEEVITCIADGHDVDVYSAGGGVDANFITDVGTTDSGAVKQIYYAAGNGLYVANSELTHAGSNRCRIWVHRYDYNQAVTTKGWSSATSGFLVTSPTMINSSDNSADGAAAGKVTLEWEDGGAPEELSDTDGASVVSIGSTGTGSWDGSYYFYISNIFDGGTESGLTPLVVTEGTVPVFAKETLSFNFSIKNAHSTGTSSTNYFGGNIRVEGARIYFKETGTAERFLLAEVSLADGVKGALDSTFTPWDVTETDRFDLETNIVFDAPPSVYSYSSLNGYYANEVYDKSGDTIATNTAGPAPLDVKYSTVVVGQNGVVYIGNVIFDKKHMPDVMMFSMPFKPGLFPKYNYFDSPSSDGSPISALAAFQDTILQFRSNALFVINVANPGQPYAEAIFRDCGVLNPCQVFTTSFGVIFVNKFGCFIYDGQKVISLTSGKFDWLNQSDITEEYANIHTGCFPCVGYDPRSQNIIVLKDIGDDTGTSSATDQGAWVYNMITQSWTEGSDMIVNGDGVRHTNFIITSDGYLAHKRSNLDTLTNYNHDKSVDTGAQTITYQTKDLDFGLPTQTKKLFKVYITYKGTPPSTINYRTDGSSTVYGFTETNWAAAGVDDYEVATLVPDTSSEGKDWKSISIYMNGSATSTFEINDISILYRVRPIK